MIEIDRMALILRAKEPFIEWLKTIADDDTLSEDTFASDPTIVLIPVIEDDEELGEYIAENCLKWLEYEFASWCAEEGQWPEDISLEAFEEYFSLHIHSLVIDNVLADYSAPVNETQH